MRHRLTAQAERDVDQLLRFTGTAFGPRQVLKYSELIDASIEMVKQRPDRLASRARPDLGGGVRSLHVAAAGVRRSSGSHVLYYDVIDAAPMDRELRILRVLHERMDPRLRVRAALKQDRR